MAQPTRPGNAERGWNDPPVFLHNASPRSPGPGSAQPVKKSALSRRVTDYSGMYGGGASPTSASPLAGNNTPTNVLPLSAGGNKTDFTPPPQSSSSMTQPLSIPSSPNRVILLPPVATTEVPRYTAPLIIPTMSPSQSPSLATNPVNHKSVTVVTSDNQDVQIPDFDDDDQLFHFTLSRLYRVLNDCQSSLKVKVSEEVTKKLEIFSSMWKDGKISYQVKSIMARLATALHTRKCDLANDLHLALMMDYVSEVGLWMVGIKRLIHEARNVEPPLSPTDCTLKQTLTDATPSSESVRETTTTTPCHDELINETGPEDTTNTSSYPAVLSTDACVTDTDMTDENLDKPHCHSTISESSS